MTTLLSILVLGTIWGAVYSLIAVGFTLIFGVAGIINLSHGAFYMLGAYLAYTFMTLLKINVPLSALMAVAGVALIGMAIDHFGIRPMRERHAYVLILTLAFALFFQELMYGIYGPYGKPVQSFVDRRNRPGRGTHFLPEADYPLCGRCLRDPFSGFSSRRPRPESPSPPWPRTKMRPSWWGFSMRKPTG